PSIEPAALDTERTIAIAGVVALRDDMYRYPMRLATQAAFPEHPYGVPIGGTEESLRRATDDQVRAWHRSRMLAAPSVIALVGDAEPDELAAMAASAFSDLEHADPGTLSPPGWPTVVTTNVEERDRAQTALALHFPGPARADADRFSARMLASVASGLGDGSSTSCATSGRCATRSICSPRTGAPPEPSRPTSRRRRSKKVRRATGCSPSSGGSARNR